MDTKTLEADLLKELFNIGAIKFGSFKLKSGITSPIYIDLRVTISYPIVLKKIADLMWKRVEGQSQFDFICGVPYTGTFPINQILQNWIILTDHSIALR